MEEEARIDDKLDGFVGASQAMKAVAERIALVAPTNTTVLVLGETGCGKELAARALHRMSRRAGGPFVAVNCAAFCESLVESELFGHERGAFTGAVAMKKGLIECANGGTLFLDEAGDLSMANQAKLLRVLQERVVERLGSTSRAKPVDIRLIAATNRDLRAAVDEGRMRLEYQSRLIQKTLDYTKGERNEAARLLHLHPKTLHRKIRELRLDGSL
jgi:transcriptional regulator with GAF, ATPase, and Fis domain